MPNYFTLVRCTQKRAETIKQSPSRADAAKKMFELAGGKMKSLYLTMGHYDWVVVSEFPNDKAVARTPLVSVSQGNIHT